jgi:hypothetical protein
LTTLVLSTAAVSRKRDQQSWSDFPRQSRPLHHP